MIEFSLPPPKHKIYLNRLYLIHISSFCHCFGAALQTKLVCFDWEQAEGPRSSQPRNLLQPKRNTVFTVFILFNIPTISKRTHILSLVNPRFQHLRQCSKVGLSHTCHQLSRSHLRIPLTCCSYCCKIQIDQNRIC